VHKVFVHAIIPFFLPDTGFFISVGCRIITLGCAIWQTKTAYLLCNLKLIYYAI